MKLYATDNSELMEIEKITKEGNNLIIEGSIMGAMPIRSVLKPAEMRRVFGLMNFKTMLFAASMLLRSTR